MRIAIIIAAGLMLSASTAQGSPPELHLLPTDQERAWIDSINSHKTEDGATVAEVLQFAELMRPRKFKVGHLSVSYNGASGDPDGVAIEYWIGRKRLPGDAIVNLGYDLREEPYGRDIKPWRWPSSIALEHGRDAFIKDIDDSFEIMCVDPITRAESC